MTKQKEEIVYTSEERVKLNNIIKANNRMKGSKYIKPTYNIFGYSYNDSRKKKVDLKEMYKNISEEEIEAAAKQVLINNK